MNVRALVPIVFLLLAAASPPAAQSRGSAQDSAVFRTGASLVALNVTVIDAKKRFVSGLEARDFAVFEDGIQQDVRFFESNAVPIDLIILLDASASMRHRLQTVHRAALGFVGTLRAGDKAAVVAFSDGVNVIQALTSDRGALEAAIRQTTAAGSTALHNALYVALKQFGRSVRESGEVRRQALAVLSDGADTSSLIGFEDVLEIAQKSGVSIYTISLASDSSEDAPASAARSFSQSDYAMRKLAQDTGAMSFFPRSADELGGIYDSIAEELSHQYSIGYTPRNPRADGRYRRITVRVPTHPELRSRARSGYLAPRATDADGAPYDR